MGRSKVKGFTLIELMIVVAIFGILIAIAVPALITTTNGKRKDVTMTMNGMVQRTCVEGYAFVVGPRGQPTQVMDEYGHGVRCE